MKKLTVLLSLFGILFAFVAFGQSETDIVVSNIQAVQNAETVSATDLGVSDAGLLPTNPFYFLKELKRNFQRVFTFNSVSKAELELKITNEKAAEVKKIQEIVPNDNVAIIKGLENYKNAQENLKNRLESLNISSTTPGIDKLLNTIAIDSVLQQKVLDEIGFRASDSEDVKGVIDLVKERMDESLMVAAKDNPINFTTSLENAFIDSKGSEFKYIRSLEIIDRLQNKIPEEARASLNRLRENFSDQLNENIKTTVQSTNSEVVQRVLSEMPGDAVRKAAIINELKEKADSTIITTLNGVSKNLEKEYLNEQDLAKKAEEQLRFVKELLKKIEEKTAQANNGTDIKSNIDVAKKHIQKAEAGFIDKKYGEVIGQSMSAEAILRKSLSLFDGKSINVEDLDRQVKEIYSKINSYSDMLNARKIIADSNPSAYEALSNAKMHAAEAEKFIVLNSMVDAIKHISEARMSLESIFKLIEQSTTSRALTPISITKPIERVVVIDAQKASCEGLKKDLEKISENLKAGLIKEDEYKLKYENLNQQLEKCSSTNQVPIIKKEQPIPNCESLKKYPTELEIMLKDGRITERDYNAKLEVVKKELEKCSSQPTPIEVSKPLERVYCTQEAKLCSDGSYVSRTGPNCEFLKCPGESSDSGSIVAPTPSTGGGSSIKCLRYDPVCGSDGKTYACGEADAQASGVGIVYRGECAKITTSIQNTEATIKEECGKENEKVNRDPLAGPVTRQCCYGLKEDRASKYYSMCIKPLESATTNTNTINTSSGSTGMANPASIYCISKGYKNVIKSNTDGSQYGVCIFNNGSECDEWKYYRGECRDDGSLNQIPPTSTLPLINTTVNTSTGVTSAINTAITNTTIACPILTPISPSAEKECTEKGGKLIAERNSIGCYLAPKCILSTTSVGTINQ